MRWETWYPAKTADLIIWVRRVLVLSVGFPRQTMLCLEQIMFYFFICSQCGLYFFLGSTALYTPTCAEADQHC